MKKECGVIQEAQQAKSVGSTDTKADDGQQESSNAATQSGPSNPAVQQAPSKTNTRRAGSCASPEFEALFVEWPFRASPRGQTSIPLFVTNLTERLPTREERIISKQLWNRSLPVAANVGIIQYNRLNGEKFKEKVDESYGEDWWRRLDDLVRELNVAAEVVVGKRKKGVVADVKGKGVERDALDQSACDEKQPEKKAIELPEGQSRESEKDDANETGEKTQEPQTEMLDRLAEAAVLVTETDEGSDTQNVNFTRKKGQETQKSSDEATETAMRLVSISSPSADSSDPEPSTIAATNPLSALWYLINRFFSSGPSAASYFLVALEAAIRVDSTTVHPLNIPASPAFWGEAAPWGVPKIGMTLIMTLAASKKEQFDAFARYTKSLGRPPVTVTEMRREPSASLRKAIIRAKDDASRKQRTTVLGVNLRDVLYSQLCEVHGYDIEKYFATFARMFVLGVCPGGAKLWLVGGDWGETATVWESNSSVGAGLGTWEEMDEFVRAFEGFAVPDAQWNTKRFKWYHRCFAVDLKQFDLQISEEEKRKRGMQEKAEGTMRLLNEIEAWVEIYKIEDVKVENLGKFTWL